LREVTRWDADSQKLLHFTGVAALAFAAAYLVMVKR
jgi:hypothetical protein